MKLMNGKVLQWEAEVPGEAPHKTSSVKKACDAFFARRGMARKSFRETMAEQIGAQKRRGGKVGRSEGGKVRRDKEAA